MALGFELAGITAHRAHQAVASCAGSLPAQSLYCHQPNCAVKRTRALPDFCGHSNLTENMCHGHPWTTKDQTL